MLSVMDPTVLVVSLKLDEVGIALLLTVTLSPPPLLLSSVMDVDSAGNCDDIDDDDDDVDNAPILLLLPDALDVESDD